METVSDFIFGGSKITADGDCSHEIKSQTTWPVSWEICMQIKKQELELDMEQQTDSK